MNQKTTGTKSSGENTSTADNTKYLKPLPKSLDGLTEDEKQRVHDIRVKGGKARGEQLKKAKSLKELSVMLLETKVSKEKAKQIIGDMADEIPPEDLTNGALLMARMLAECYENGTAKSAEFIRDTSGQKPQTEISLQGEIITASDRDLLANIADRYRTENDENS